MLGRSCASRRRVPGSRRSGPARRWSGPPSRSGRRCRRRRPPRCPNPPAGRLWNSGSLGVRPASAARCPPAEQPAMATKLRSPPNLSTLARAHAIAVLTSVMCCGQAVIRCHAVVDGQAHPAELGQVRHQRVALQDPAAVHPGAAGHEDHHRGGLGGQSFGRHTSSSWAGLSPYRTEVRWMLRRCSSALHTGGVRLGRGPFDVEGLGGHDAAQRGLRRPRWSGRARVCAISAMPGVNSDFAVAARRSRACAACPRCSSRWHRQAARGACRSPAATSTRRSWPACGPRGWRSATSGCGWRAWVRDTGCPVEPSSRELYPRSHSATVDSIWQVVVPPASPPPHCELSSQPTWCARSSRGLVRVGGHNPEKHSASHLRRAPRPRRRGYRAS